VCAAEIVAAEIVAADSRTLYRGMDIGTSKPTAGDRERVPHHVLDIAQPDEVVTLATYQGLAVSAIDAIRARNRLPLLVGGAGLYIHAVVDRLRIPSSQPDWALRAALEAEERAGGPGTLHRRLGEVDPVAATRIHPRNTRRLIRALEVYAKTGVPISALQAAPPAASSGGRVTHAPADRDLVMVALTADRAALYDRIHRRIDQQLAAGLVEEVRALIAAGYARTLPAFQGLGYKEIVPHLEGRISLEESRALLQRNTRRYAKRQLTWLRADGRYRWVDVGDDPPEVVASRIGAILREQAETADFPGDSSHGC
jgi:tRNA dimethylallyltransferase